MDALRAIWRPIRRVLIAVGMVLGTINISILLTIFYLVFFPWVRLGYWLSGKDPMGRRLFASRASTWVELQGSARSPTGEDLERMF